jgi:parallel beta-helix repeat protein
LVDDGDTISVWIENIVVPLDPTGEVYENTQEILRYGGGIDAPEDPWEEGGPESSEFMRGLIPPGSTVYIDLDNLGVDVHGRPYRDSGGRLLGVVYAVIDEQWVNVLAEILRWGMVAYPANEWDRYTYLDSEHSVYNWPPYDNTYPYVLGFTVPRDPIYIVGNDNFTSANGVIAGSGTLGDPYVIAGWDINAENSNGIEIRDTTAHFIIRNSYVHGGRDNGFDGIRFENVVNGRVDVRSENNYHGINFLNSNNNVIINSTFENSTYGIRLVNSNNNRIYHNNLMNNANQAHDNGANYWDDGYPSGGNYWSDYPGADNYWGEDQNIPGSDGIGDTPYNIPSGANQDRYPFIITPVSRKVEVLISPSYQSVPPGATLAYTVTIINTGNIVDNYVLGVSDSASWGPSISSGSLMVLPGASDNITLSITVPENAEPGTEDNITITATSQTDNTVSDSDLCTAHALSPIAEFGLTTLYGVSLDLNIYLGEGSRLVVKFYTWAGPFQAENVVWSGVTPAHVVLLMNVSHPENTAVQNATLVSTDDMGNVISTIASFTVTRDDLFMRIMAIKGEWPLPDADQDALFQEIMDIKGVWPIAPS